MVARHWIFVPARRYQDLKFSRKGQPMTEPQSMLELEPCPFCNGEAGYYASGEAVFKVNWIGHVCHCKNCQARVQTSASMEAAIAMWNARSTAAAQPIMDDLEHLVERFSKALLAKLKLARANGRSGWDHTDWEKECQEGFLRHLAKGDPRDVAAYCAFMWHHGWITVAATPSLSLRAR